MKLRELSLFSGYGGFSLGLKLAGLEVQTVGYCEIEPYCQEIIKARIKDGHLDDAPIFPDIRAFDGAQYRGLVDIVTGGFPCQPHSVAGKRAGALDSRNLWPDTLRVIGDVGPAIAILENVPGILANGYAGTVVGQLAEAGYDCTWDIVSARDVGRGPPKKPGGGRAGSHDAGQPSPRDAHQRLAEPDTPSASGRHLAFASTPRLPESSGGGAAAGPPGGDASERGYQELPRFPPGPGDRAIWAAVLARWPELAPALANPRSRDSQQPARKSNGDGKPTATRRARSQSSESSSGDSFDAYELTPESPVRGVVDGPAHRVDRLKALGNGVVPAVVAEFLRRVRKDS